MPLKPHKKRGYCGICGMKTGTRLVYENKLEITASEDIISASPKYLKAVGEVCEDCWDNRVTDEELEQGNRPDD